MILFCRWITHVQATYVFPIGLYDERMKSMIELWIFGLKIYINLPESYDKLNSNFMVQKNQYIYIYDNDQVGKQN